MKVPVEVKQEDVQVTWVEEDDGPQAAQLRFVHLHVFHLGDQLCQDPAWTLEQRVTINNQSAPFLM